MSSLWWTASLGGQRRFLYRTRQRNPWRMRSLIRSFVGLYQIVKHNLHSMKVTLPHPEGADGTCDITYDGMFAGKNRWERVAMDLLDMSTGFTTARGNRYVLKLWWTASLGGQRRFLYRTRQRNPWRMRSLVRSFVG